MQEHAILDHEATVKPKSKLPRKIALIVEVSLWGFIIISNYQPWRSDVQFILRKTLAPPDSTLIALLVAMLFYLLFPILVFKSKNWKQHIVSHLCGLVISLFIMSFFFKLESWPFANELGITASGGSMVFGIASLVLLLKNIKSGAKSFYLNVFIRMAIPALMVLTVLIRSYQQENPF